MTHRFELVASSASNQNILLYSPETHHMVHIVRDRHRVLDKVYEDWIDFDLQAKFFAIQGKRVLAMHLAEEDATEIKAVMLFEGGTLASFRLPFREVKSARLNNTNETKPVKPQVPHKDQDEGSE